MPKLNLKTFEKKIRVRPLRMDDYPAVVELQKLCFEGMNPWSEEQWASHQRIFPDGQIGIEYQKRLVASSSSLVVDFAHYTEWHDFAKITDGGTIRNHDPQGDTLYGIEIMVHPEFRGMRLARRLYDARKELCRRLNLARIMIAGRIPGYDTHAHEMTPREYVEKVVDKTLVDPVLTPQIANGFVLKGLIPAYLPGDTESRGFATFLEWVNLDHIPFSHRRLAPIEPVRLAIVQYEMRKISSFQEFEWQCEYFVDVAADYHADFVLFPELVTTQLLCLIESGRPGQAARRLTDFTSQYLELMTRLATRYNVNIVGGSHFLVEDEKLYNVAFLFRRDGTLERQAKLHITPNERRWWGVSPGDRLHVLDTDRGKIAILVCYDVEFPELARIAVDQGARILFVPFNTEERSGYLRVRHCAQARAIENDVFVAIAGCTGNLPFVDNVDIHYAQSAIFTPSDVVFARDAVAGECTPNVEMILVHDVDTELLRRQRVSGTVQNWTDRRRDLYRVIDLSDGGDPSGT